MLNPIEKFKVAILHMNRDSNHCFLSEYMKWLPTFLHCITMNMISLHLLFLRMYCTGPKALVFMFSPFSAVCPYTYMSRPYSVYMHHWFLAPQAYLCSTSLMEYSLLINFIYTVKSDTLNLVDISMSNGTSSWQLFLEMWYIALELKALSISLTGIIRL